MATASIPWQTLSEAYAFLGNSLLAPMSQTASVGLDPDFWREFPDFDDDDVAKSLAGCVRYAKDASQRVAAGENMVQEVSVEYTHLFVGPPSPFAAPWETMYRSDTNIGFGEATVQMRALLRRAGLELKNENNQYEDHMGIELIYLSVLCRWRAEALDAPAADDIASDGAVFTFIETHPMAWVGAFGKRVVAECPGGYFDNVITLVEAILRLHARLLAQ